MSWNSILISTSVATRWVDVKDTILRLIDYLGNNFIKMNFRDMDFDLKSYENSPFNGISKIKDDDITLSIVFYYSIETQYFSIERKELNDINLGDFSKFTELEIHTIDDVLKPFKSYEPGCHSDDPDYIKRCTEYEFSTFNRSIVFYPMSKVSGRSGYNWFLTPNCRLKEICIAKYTNGYFEARMVSQRSYVKVMLYIAKDLDSLINLINDKVTNL